MTQPTDPPATGQPARRFIPLLRLVAPSLPTPRKKGTRPPPVFSEAEQVALRSSLRTGRHVLGSWKALGAAMHVHPATIKGIATGKGKPVTAEIAVRLARALKVPLDVITRPLLRSVQAPGPNEDVS